MLYYCIYVYVNYARISMTDFIFDIHLENHENTVI